MLKLTIEADEGSYVYIRASQISALLRIAGDLTQLRAGGRDWWVTETPEQIMAMPEMRAEIDRAMLAAYPPMMVGNNSPDHVMSYNTNWPYTSQTFGSNQTAKQVGCCVSQHCPNWRG